MAKDYYTDSYGNKYTDHAVTGMQPSGHRFNGNDGGKGSGVIHYTDAKGNDCDGSSIPAMVVDDVLKNGTSTTSKSDSSCKVYTLNGIEVVVNKDGAVVTTTKKY